MKGIEYSYTYFWALDFTRKVCEFGIVRRLLLRLVLGKHGFREFVGMKEAIEDSGLRTDGGYELEDVEYHEDKVSWVSLERINHV